MKGGGATPGAALGAVVSGPADDDACAASAVGEGVDAAALVPAPAWGASPPAADERDVVVEADAGEGFASDDDALAGPAVAGAFGEPAVFAVASVTGAPAFVRSREFVGVEGG